MVKGLEKKNILITGASSGIGLDIATVLNKSLPNIYICGRNEEALSKFSLNLKKSNPNFRNYFSFDLCNFEHIVDVVKAIDPLDGLVLNAGVIDYTPAKLINNIKIEKIFNTNVFSNILLIQQLLIQKKISKNASIIFISSISSQVAVPGTSLYAASKAAINSYAKVLASELSNLFIRVNIVSPGIIMTDLIKNTNSTSDEQYELIKKKYPFGFGNKSDISNIVEFLISDNSKWITGSNFNIDGGYLLNN